jgi:hypothetical protein
MDLYAKSLGGDRAVAEVKSLHFQGTHRSAAAPQDEGKAVDVTESAKSGEGLESMIRWQLLHGAARPEDFHGKVIRSDEVRGRIAVVIDSALDLPRTSRPTATSQPTSAADDDESPHRLHYTASFCDADGCLLAIDFTDPNTKKVRRFEYGEEKRTGVLRLPHLRWYLEDDRPISEDIFDKVEASGG